MNVSSKRVPPSDGALGRIPLDWHCRASFRAEVDARSLTGGLTRWACSFAVHPTVTKTVWSALL